ncbi:MAG: HINT domain-containing protein, partial [Caulobacterales bacterium]|nr:HINT domain-containing protein [Caulobacterales bacterium]
MELEGSAGIRSTHEVTGNHPYWAEGRGWTQVEALRPGDQIAAADGDILTVTALAATGEMQPVFNFEVDDHHTYFVGGDGAWVHDCDPLPVPTLTELADNLKTQTLGGASVTGRSP